MGLRNIINKLKDIFKEKKECAGSGYQVGMSSRHGYYKIILFDIMVSDSEVVLEKVGISPEISFKSILDEGIETIEENGYIPINSVIKVATESELKVYKKF